MTPAGPALAADLRGRIVDGARAAAGCRPRGRRRRPHRRRWGPDGRFDLTGSAGRLPAELRMTLCRLRRLDPTPVEAWVRQPGRRGPGHPGPALTRVAEIVVTLASAPPSAAPCRPRRSPTTSSRRSTANDVGKLPDQNVAEAVHRLPGVTIANDQGEGRYVIIRGVDPRSRRTSRSTAGLPPPAEPDNSPGQAGRHPLVADRRGLGDQEPDARPRRRRHRWPGRHRHAVGLRPAMEPSAAPGPRTVSST
ncbi:TonB-dependent receptor plug domain-containing protein [Caulobacter segnis]